MPNHPPILIVGLPFAILPLALQIPNQHLSQLPQGGIMILDQLRQLPHFPPNMHDSSRVRHLCALEYHLQALVRLELFGNVHDRQRARVERQPDDRHPVDIDEEHHNAHDEVLHHYMHDQVHAVHTADGRYAEDIIVQVRLRVGCS
jgi:hypothetical protein